MRADAAIDSLSGGELSKLLLAEVLNSEAELLVLDEPTNHLDLPGIRWLESVLAAYRGAVLLVSHDRALLDRVATRLLILPGDGSAPEIFAGNYSEWAAERDRRLREQGAAFGRQQRHDRRLQDHLAQLESRSRYIENSTINFTIRKKAKKIARRSTTMKRRLEREASAVTRIERPREQAGGIRTPFAATERSTSRLVELRGVTLAVGDRTLLTGLDLVVERGARIALVGSNGSGKATLIRAILGEAQPPAGSVVTAGSAQVGDLGQDEALDDASGLAPLDLIRREGALDAAAAGNLLHRVLPGHEQRATPIERLSYGERRRLALAILMLRGCNVLLLLDEPTNHLDIASRESVEAALRDYDGAVLAVTHDRAFIAAATTGVWSIEAGRVVERGREEVV